MTDTQRQKLQDLADDLGNLISTKVSAVTLAYMVYDALRILAEEPEHSTVKLGKPRPLEPPTADDDGWIYGTFVKQEEPVSDTYKSPAPLNAPPPDDMPCYGFVCDEFEENGDCDWDLIVAQDVGMYHHWQPCFVPLDALPDSVWVLWPEGQVTYYPPGDEPVNRHIAKYVFTVPPKEEV